jgi:hypothetical protein
MLKGFVFLNDNTNTCTAEEKKKRRKKKHIKLFAPLIEAEKIKRKNHELRNKPSSCVSIIIWPLCITQ